MIHPEAKTSFDPETTRRLRLVSVATVLAGASVLTGLLSPGRDVISGLFALVAAIVVAAPIVRDTLVALRSTGFAATQFYMDQYVVLAVAACIASGNYLTGAVVAIVLVLGQVLEERAVIGVEQALSNLRNLSRVRASKVTPGGGIEEIDSENLREGDRVRVRPGEAVPGDGVVYSGESSVDQSAITGESIPADVAPGSEVYAGTTNLTGLIEVDVTSSGDATVVSRVADIVEEAKSTEAPIVRLAEDYAKYYTPLVLLIAAAVFLFTQDLERAIAVLIVSIPCAFVLASPSAMVAAIAVASRMGILVKGTRNLEVGQEIDTVVFDKTGTLTRGKLSVSKVVAFPGWDEEDVLRYAASVEQHSKHPVALAACREAGERRITAHPPENLSEAAGLGVTADVLGVPVVAGREKLLLARGLAFPTDGTMDPLLRSVGSLLYVGIGDRVAGCLVMEDTVRAESVEVIAALRERGIDRVVMLTGDRYEVAVSLAASLGIDTFKAGCLPEDKRAEVERLRAEGRKVMVVGDGVNDAPALAAGDLGIAMGALGNDVAINTADIALMSDDLRRLPDLLDLARSTVSVINQNLICGFLFIVLAIVVSSAGFISPVVAAFVHEFSAFFVIFNSARLLRFDCDEEQEAAGDLPLALPPVVVAPHPS